MVASLNKKWGYLDENGKEIISFKFDGADMFSDGLAAVFIGNKIGFIDKTGKLVIENVFTNIVTRFENGKAIVVKDNKQVTIDKTGKEIKG
ncbi:MAG: WG repeat-containing protein [Flavisolibacter sp.]